jgi:hypothetical protein
MNRMLRSTHIPTGRDGCRDGKSRTVGPLLVGLATAVLASGGLGWAGLELGAGTAHADVCNPRQGGCWCPGGPMPPSHTPITWDMSQCHKWHQVRGASGQWDTVEGWGPPSPGFPWP